MRTFIALAIAREILIHLFDRFFTGHAVGSLRMCVNDHYYAGYDGRNLSRLLNSSIHLILLHFIFINLLNDLRQFHSYYQLK